MLIRATSGRARDRLSVIERTWKGDDYYEIRDEDWPKIEGAKGIRKIKEMPWDRRARLKKKRDEAVDKVVGGWLLSVGARKGKYYAYELDTPLGVLAISPHDVWIACRFDDRERAKANLGEEVGKFSAKWNHLYPDSYSPEDMLWHFKGALKRIGWIEKKEAL